MSKLFITPWRLATLSAILAVGFGAVAYRLANLHIIKRETLTQKAEASRKSLVTLTARRGNIVDTRGNLIAATRPVIEVGIDPQTYDPAKDAEKLPELARLLGLPLETVVSAANRKMVMPADGISGEVKLIHWVKLADKVEEPEFAEIQKLKIKAVYGNRRYERYYPGNNMAAHVLGYIGYVDREVETADGVEKETVLQPLMGVERYMDFYLRGQDGWRETEHDGRRRELAQYRREISPTDGLNVELTLDMVIQTMAENEIERLVQEYNPDGVSIIVSRPATGEILALANYPTFNPNEFWKSDVSALKNRAVSDVFEPGSTFKIVAASAALNEKIVTPTTVIDCEPGVAEYRNRQIRLPKDDHRLGKATVREIVYKSSNRGAAHLGMMLGEDRMYEYARAFGFGEATGYGAGGEVNGILHPVSRWDGLTISRLPMGHAISATPMQVHFAMATMANGGVLMEPHIVKRVVDDQGQTVVAFAPRMKRRVVSPTVAKEMAEMLEKTVSPQGTANRATIPGYQAAGKTGTSQKIIDGKYSNTHHIATFSGFFPASAPEVAITIIVDEPHMKGTGYGGIVAAPCFKNIGERIIQYLAIKPPPTRGEQEIAGTGGSHAGR